MDQVKNSSRTPLVSVLLHGQSGAGKTALAATIALSSEFPFIKLISPESMVGYTEQSKITHISKVFNDAYKSPYSVIVIDSIERILDWVSIGPRFSNAVLQTLLVLLKKPPPEKHKLMILATTNQRSVLQEMEMVDAFNSSMYVPNVTSLSAVDIILRELKAFNDTERQAVQSKLAGTQGKLSVGIKKLIYMSEMACQDVDKVDKFTWSLQQEGFNSR